MIQRGMRGLRAAWLLLMSCPLSAQTWRGVDASFLPEMIHHGVVYHTAEGGGIEEPRAWMRDQGVNVVRLRVWHNPHEGLHSSWLEVVDEAEMWHNLGVDVLLDFHFSDTWADPGHQTLPGAWEGMSFQAVKSAMACHVRCALEVLEARGAPPAMVQLGNEINPGMMWPHGALDNGFDALSELLQAGSDVVHEVFPECTVLVHVAGLEAAPWFFDNLASAGFVPDMLAVSQYSKWHLQDLTAVADHVSALSSLMNRPVFLAETAYAWTSDWADWTDNLWWTGDETPGYAFSPEGQRDYLAAMDAELAALGPDVCAGWCYWAPDWVASQGETSTEGSAWENAALFDFEWKALPAWEVFNTD